MNGTDARFLGARATNNRIDGYVDDLMIRIRSGKQPAIRQKYLLLSIPRVGSHWLADHLRSQGDMGIPYEWYADAYIKRVQLRFKQRVTMRQYTDLVLAGSTTPNGVFALKAQFSHLAYMRQTQKFNILDIGFDKIIWNDRHDVLAQAYSYTRSLKSNVWSRLTEQEREVERLSNPQMVIETSAVLSAATQLVEWKESFEQQVRPVTDLCIYYEDLLAKGTGDAVNAIRGLLGLPALQDLTGPGRYEKQARPDDHASIEAIRAYLNGNGQLPTPFMPATSSPASRPGY